MHPVLKWTTIFGLFLISIAASIFMVLESGSFYQKLYPKDYGFVQLGFLAAALNEIFMSIMAGAWLPGKTKKGKTKGHPINFFFRLLLVLLFTTTVGGASFNLVYSKFEILQNQNNQKEVIAILQSQIRDNKTSLQIFTRQNQRVNSVLAVRQQHATKQKLMEELAKAKSAASLWFEIIFIITLRFGVQLANLCCVWIAAWIYRNHRFSTARVKNVETSHNSDEVKRKAQTKAEVQIKQQEQVQMQAPDPKICQPIVAEQQLNKSTPDTKSKPSKETKEIILTTELEINKAPPETKKDRKKSSKLKEASSKLATVPFSTTFTSQRIGKKSKMEAVKKKVQPLRAVPKIKIVQPEEPAIQANIDQREISQEKDRQRNAIRQLLKSRNEGVSLSQFAQTLGIGAQRLEEIYYTRTAVEEFTYEELESIHHQLERLYEERYAI